jgi:DNA-nicking Smr family endonuclease
LAAQQLNSQVSHLHNEAASKIFSERNKSLKTQSGGEVVIDLHGLHPLEAVDKLKDLLRQLKTKRYKGKAIIVTGTGHHSRGKSKVLPMIRDHLQQCGWNYRDATMQDNRGGVLVIEIK